MQETLIGAGKADLASSPAGRRLALVLEYEGTEYAGFQFQASEVTIQGEVEKALKQFTGRDIRIRAASRTDSGAHAVGQVVDFTCDSSYSTETFVGALNFYLPDDIRVTRAVEARGNFHSRRDAESRVYQYRILNRSYPSPLYRRHCHWVRESLKIQEMQPAAQNLLGVHDFRPFVSGHPMEKSAIRQVYRWDVEASKDDPNLVIITCEANGFMQHQIRRTNAVLVEIGKGNLTGDVIRKILGEDRNSTPTSPAITSVPTLPAKGLCLTEVKYRNSWAQGESNYETNQHIFP